MSSARNQTMPMRLLLPLRNPGIYIGVALALLLVVGAYQVRPTYDISIGTTTDANILEGFNTPEVLSGTLPLQFRWTTGDALITLQAIGRQDYDVTLNISGFRPPDTPPAQLIIEAAGGKLAELFPQRDFTDYHYTIPREAVRDGTLQLRLISNEFEPPDDPNPRPLGVMLTRVTVEPSAQSGVDLFIEPPLDLLGAVLGTSLLLALALAMLGWGMGGVTLGSALPALLAAWMLVADRFWLTGSAWYLAWPGVVFAGLILLLLAYTVGGWLLRLGGVEWTATQRRVLLTVMLAAFVARLAGQLHPIIFIPDAGFHAHRFEIVESGQLLFTAPSSEWGKRANFYLPTAYIFMLPLQWLLQNELLVAKLFMVAISTLGCLPLFYIAARMVRDGRAGLIAVSLYVSLPIAVLSFSWGIATNLFGEFMALCAMSIAVGMYGSVRPNRPAFYALLAVLFVALLSHPGVVQLVGLAFVLIFVPMALLKWPNSERRGAAWTLAALALASVAAYLAYYTNFAGYMLKTFGELSAERAAQAAPQTFHVLVGGSVVDKSLGLQGIIANSWSEWLLAGPRWFLREARAYYGVWPFAAAALGFIAIWPPLVGGPNAKQNRQKAEGSIDTQHSALSTQHSSDRRRLLVWMAAGWFMAALAYGLVGWVANLFVRYMLFALPMLSLGAGILLSKLWGRGRAGVLLTVLLIGFVVVAAFALWGYRISYSFKT